MPSALTLKRKSIDMAIDLNVEPWRSAAELLCEMGSDAAISRLNQHTAYLAKAGLESDARFLRRVMVAVLTLGPGWNPSETLH